MSSFWKIKETSKEWMHGKSVFEIFYIWNDFTCILEWQFIWLYGVLGRRYSLRIWKIFYCHLVSHITIEKSGAILIPGISVVFYLFNSLWKLTSIMQCHGNCRSTFNPTTASIHFEEAGKALPTWKHFSWKHIFLFILWNLFYSGTSCLDPLIFKNASFSFSIFCPF